VGGAALSEPFASRRLVVLGATGSIGGQALEVADRLGMDVVGLAAGHLSAGLIELAGRHPRATVAVARVDETDLAASLRGRLAVGDDAVAALAAAPGVAVVNGIVGFAGLAPTLAALGAGNAVALANKESLVAGGPLVEAALAEGGGRLVPVDSEHSAIWQCLAGEDRATVARVVLTASGGPFRGRRREELVAVTPAEALAHPTWRMGRRITIDSATLMNKAFEVIEAHHLFHLPYERIAVVVHPQSFVHSLVEFVDGTVKAEVGPPDMRKPIQYALTGPERVVAPHPPLDLVGKELRFEAPDPQAFPCLELGYEAGRRGGTAPAALNAADEVAVAAFLDGAIGFLDIPEVVARALAEDPATRPRSMAEVVEADRRARAAAAEEIARRRR